MNGNFTVIHNSTITDKNIDSYEYRILSYLISCSNDGQCFPSNETISEKTGIGLSTVKNRLPNLIEKKYINKNNRSIGTGKKTSNLYTINRKYLVTREAKYEDRQNVSRDVIEYDWLNENYGSNH